MEAKDILYIRLTQNEITSINGENKSEGGSSQTYIDIPTGCISNDKLNHFFGNSFNDKGKPEWKFNVNSLGLNTDPQEVIIKERRPGTNSLRNQLNNRIKNWQGNGFPVSSKDYDQDENPVIVYFIKDSNNIYWAGWFYRKDFTTSWFVNIELAEIVLGSKRAGIINLSMPVLFSIDEIHWPFVKNVREIRETKSAICQNHEQIIFYGTPGSGKSRKVKDDYDEKYPNQVIRTTFHPDTDYASFVGGYKPVVVKKKDKDGRIIGEEQISYKFVPQCFTKAYIKAWNNMDKKIYLVIEEINRGNCAQIFGDIFQLLDRDKKSGYSEYPIDADTDLMDFLLNGKDKNGNDILANKDGIEGGKLKLPPNLSLIATMNTSDQSLFPMDTAFKRRWAWEYVPIDYSNQKESSAYKINIGDKQYSWIEFLEAINAKILDKTSSEDKQMGNFFIKHDVGEKEFKEKVMFYLWSEIGKDNYHTSDAIFFRYNNDEEKREVEFTFNDLFKKVSEDNKNLHETDGTQMLMDFMDILKVEPK